MGRTLFCPSTFCLLAISSNLLMTGKYNRHRLPAYEENIDDQRKTSK